MAEEFLNRLDQIEEKIEGLGETLKRMITILSSTTDIKSDVRAAKDDILEAISTSQTTAEGFAGISQDEVRSIVTEELESFSKRLDERFQTISDKMVSSFEEMIASVPQQAPKTTAAVQASPQGEATVPSTSSIPGDRSIKVADELQRILDSLKMGCVAGDVLDTMTEAKENIMKIVPSDPIMVKIDKWAAIVKSYNLRHELQARDILKIKNELREEIPKYGLS
ncbi:hypothetical protein EU537_03270 [Candidatus Thorarchaeota archaeon]|nr:MAG: hypothetical protein EU537_03270 [Candidatus Thorarchaeota archaeon]